MVVEDSMDTNDGNLSSIIELRRPTTRNKTRSFNFSKSLSRNSSSNRRSKSRHKTRSRDTSLNEGTESINTDSDKFMLKTLHTSNKSNDVLRETK